MKTKTITKLLSYLIGFGSCMFAVSAIAETEIQPHMDWQIRTITDDFTDDRQVILNTKIDAFEEDFSSERGIMLIGSGRFGALGTGGSGTGGLLRVEPVNEAVTDMLVIKCDKAGAKPYLVVLTDEFVEGHHTRNIEYRVDKRTSQTILMKSRDKYLMVFDSRKVARLIEQLRSGSLLIGRSKDKRGKPVNFRIPIRGLEEIEHNLYSHCKRP